jgi:hypothetical protein
MRIEKEKRPMLISFYPNITAITEADRKAWWESGKGTYNADLVAKIIKIKRLLS